MMDIREAIELGEARKFAWDGLHKDILDNDGTDVHIAMEWAFRQGFESGYKRGRTRTTIELANEFHGNGYPPSWFGPINWHRRTLRLQAFLNQLWEQYGPVEYDEDDLR